MGDPDFSEFESILVTGGAGFIGSHLVERLLAHDCEVVALDNYYTGSRRNLAHLMDNPRLDIVRHDVRNPFWGEFDLILNLACPASPVFYQKNPVGTAKISFLGTLNMLGLAKRTGARFLQASTSEVYGDPKQHPQTEEYHGNVNPIGIRSCYDEGKRIAESLCADYRRQHNMDIKVVRIFNTYGPRMNPQDGRVVSNFIVQALKGEDITIYGDGEQTRSFCYVDELVDGIIKMSLSPEGEFGPVNLGNPGEFTVLELAEIVIEMTGSSSRIIKMPLPEDDPKQRKPDIRRAADLLDWEPTITLRQGLEHTISYFEQRLRKDAA